MNPPPNREVTLFSAALELPVGERAGYLAEACADDPTLRVRVEALLRVHQDAITFLENKAPGAPESPMRAERPDSTVRIAAGPSEKPGDRIGRYKLLQQIGEGGCGVVYMAEQEEPVRRHVAIKVIKLGMDTKSVIARFEAERQALALMDHPSIARVLDAGATDTGRPYFVMELVRGIKITEFCDQKQLSTRERLDLFVQVCQAIQHAHQKGIIHRDIKPSNILVTLRDGVPVPKVIDFGIAKATTDQRLTDKTLFTQFEMFLGTPAYMSPEQAEMSELGIDTRSDIYSLGILLYELLTGTTPFDARELMKAGLVEIRRIIREEEPARPSTRLTTMAAADLTDVARHRHVEPGKLSSLIRGDLDWIVLKALEKDRARRYETANGLAGDVQRHLNCEPVIARPPSRLYEFEKTVRRHKFGFAAAGGLIFVLAGGVVVSTSEAIRAVRAERQQTQLRQRAEAGEKKASTEAAKSEQVAAFLKDMLQSVGPSVALGRDTKMLREILDKTAERVGRDLANQPEAEGELSYTLGEVYWALGDPAKAEAMHRRGLKLRQTVLGGEHPQVAQSMRRLGHVLWREGKLEEAVSLSRGAVAMQRKLLGNENLELAGSLQDLAAVVGQDPGAAVALREALAIQRKLLGQEHVEVADTLGALGAVLGRDPRPRTRGEAESLCREGLAIKRKLLGLEHPSVAGALNGLGRVLLSEGKPAEAESALTEALAIRQKLLGHEHPDVAQSLGNLSRLRAYQGRLEEAASLQREALALQKKLLGPENLEVATSIEKLAIVLRNQSKLSEAENLFRESMAMRVKLLGSDGYEVAGSLQFLAQVLLIEEQYPATESAARESVAIYTKHRGREDLMVARSLYYLGRALYAQGRSADAEAAFREAVATRRKFYGGQHADTGMPLYYLAEVLRSEGRLAEAAALYCESAECGFSDAQGVLRNLLKAKLDPAVVETLAREMLAWQRARLGNDSPAAAETLSGLAATLFALGKPAEADAAARKAAQNAPNDAELQLRIAELFCVQAKWAEAEHYYREAARILRATRKASEAAFVLHAHALQAHGQSFFPQAERAYRDALASYHEAYGGTHAEIARCLYDLGRVLSDQAKYAEGEAPARESLAMRRKLFRDSHPDVIRSLVGLIQALQGQGKRSEAEPFFREAAEHADAQTLNELAWRLATDPDPKLRDGPMAVTLAERAVAGTNRTNPIIMDTLAVAYAAAGQFTNAVRVQQEAISLLQNEPEKKDYASRLKLYENNSPYQDPSALASLASDRLRDGKFAEAEVLARECLAIRELQIPDDWRTFNVRSVLGGALLGQKKFSEAEPLLLLGYDGMKQREDNIPADGKPRLAQSLQRLVQLYEATNRPEQAAEWKRKLAEFDKTPGH